MKKEQPILTRIFCKVSGDVNIEIISSTFSKGVTGGEYQNRCEFQLMMEMGFVIHSATEGYCGKRRYRALKWFVKLFPVINLIYNTFFHKVIKEA